MADPGAPTPNSRTKSGLVGVGVIVIALGFGLPQILSINAPSLPTGPEINPPAAKIVDSGKQPKQAVPAGPETNPSVAPVGDLGWSLARLVGGLAVVCVLCVVVTRYLNRSTPAPTSSALTLVASARVDARCGLYLVRAGDRRLLLGLDPGGVKALIELPGTPPPDEVPLPPPVPAKTEASPAEAALPPSIPAEIEALIASFRVSTPIDVVDPTRRF